MYAQLRAQTDVERREISALQEQTGVSAQGSAVAYAALGGITCLIMLIL